MTLVDIPGLNEVALRPADGVIIEKVKRGCPEVLTGRP